MGTRTFVKGLGLKIYQGSGGKESKERSVQEYAEFDIFHIDDCRIWKDSAVCGESGMGNLKNYIFVGIAAIVPDPACIKGVGFHSYSGFGSSGSRFFTEIA